MKKYSMQLIALSLILAFAHFFGQRIDLKGKIFAVVKSFSAGVSIAYVFISLLPELFRVSDAPTVAHTLLPVAIGVTVYHVLIRLLTSHHKKAHKKGLETKERMHLLILLLAGFSTSYMSMQVINQDLRAGLIVVAVLFIHYLLMDIVGYRINSKPGGEGNLWQFGLAISPTLAALLVLSGSVVGVVNELLFGFAIGTIFYTTLHEEIPSEKEGQPLVFALGVLTIILMVFTGL